MINPYREPEADKRHPKAQAIRAMQAIAYEKGYNDRIAEEQALLMAKADQDIKRAKP